MAESSTLPSKKGSTSMKTTRMDSTPLLARLSRLGIAVIGVAGIGCDTASGPSEPFAPLVEAVLDLEDAGRPAAAPAPAPVPVPIANPSAQPRCVLDGDGDGILSLSDYASAVPMGIDECAGQDGAVLGNIGGVLVPSQGGSGDGSLDYLGIEAPTVAAGGNISVPANTPIPQVVLDWVKDTGIPDKQYEEDSYDCDDFASDLEKAFEGLVPGAGTFTYIACDFDEEENDYTSAHAITDVHGDGAIAWIEPQNGQQVNLDKDGDGMVTFATDFSGYSSPNEGGCFVAVFESAQAAQDAGLTLD